MAETLDGTMTQVLADVAAWVLVAWVLGAVAYRLMAFAGPLRGWNELGRVGVAPYRWVEGLIVVVLGGLIWMGLRSLADGGSGMVAAPEAGEPIGEKLLRQAGESATQGPGVTDLVANVLFLLMVCLGLLFYLRQVRELNPVELFGIRRLNLRRALGWAVVALLVWLPVVAGVNLLAIGWLKAYWPDLGPQDSVRLFLESPDLASKAVLALAAVVVAPLVEETVFRGFVYGVVKRFSDPVFASITSSALFALAHFHLASTPPLFVLAIGFTIVYELSGSLVVPMIMHGLFNALSLALLVVFGESM